MDFRAVFLATWREISDSVERQYLIENVLGHSDDAVADKMRTQGSLLTHSFQKPISQTMHFKSSHAIHITPLTF